MRLFLGDCEIHFKRLRNTKRENCRDNRNKKCTSRTRHLQDLQDLQDLLDATLTQRKMRRKGRLRTDQESKKITEQQNKKKKEKRQNTSKPPQQKSCQANGVKYEGITECKRGEKDGKAISSGRHQVCYTVCISRAGRKSRECFPARQQTARRELLMRQPAGHRS